MFPGRSVLTSVPTYLLVLVILSAAALASTDSKDVVSGAISTLEDKLISGRYRRAPGWGKRAPGWGKRAPGWGKRAPGWGKRSNDVEVLDGSEETLNELRQLAAVAENVAYSAERFETDKRAPGWGKRAPGWGKRAPGWGKRSLCQDEPCSNGNRLIFKINGYPQFKADQLGGDRQSQRGTHADNEETFRGNGEFSWQVQSEDTLDSFGKPSTPASGEKLEAVEEQFLEDSDNDQVGGFLPSATTLTGNQVYLHKRAPGWGKRNDELEIDYPESDADKRAPGWGKRAPGWGKRAPGWGKRAPGWGKRSQESDQDEDSIDVEQRAPGWGKRAPGWGKRSVRSL